VKWTLTRGKKRGTEKPEKGDINTCGGEELGRTQRRLGNWVVENGFTGGPACPKLRKKGGGVLKTIGWPAGNDASEILDDGSEEGESEPHQAGFNP